MKVNWKVEANLKKKKEARKRNFKKFLTSSEVQEFNFEARDIHFFAVRVTKAGITILKAIGSLIGIK